MSSHKIKTIADLTPDSRNARKHNPRNIGMIRESLGKVGAARSIVIDEDGNILAGNGTVEALADAGIEKVRVIETDGEEIVAVMRKNLTPEQKIELALADNRTAELAEWDPIVLEELNLEVPEIIGEFFRENEIDEIISRNQETLQEQENVLDQAVQLKPDVEYIVVICKDEDEFIDVRQRLGMGEVRRGGYKKGSQFDSTGKERVIKAENLLSKLSNADSDSK